MIKAHHAFDNGQSKYPFIINIGEKSISVLAEAVAAFYSWNKQITMDNLTLMRVHIIGRVPQTTLVKVWMLGVPTG